ncbi:MAG: single-stranded-DNA-specific exonuclease RecJ [Scytolyngbya sp. HA4215-MV1]|jgi:single-stranded-DNA-specific exonuclease|nr:single-stranded-DNA-specific exonuclease RecJ [Scytolyngbya sp. HA4215-MV1]
MNLSGSTTSDPLDASTAHLEPTSSPANFPTSPSALTKIPDQRWQIFPAQPEDVAQIVQATELSPLLAQVLLNRGICTPEQAKVFLQPEAQELPSPLEAFQDLPLSLELLINAINQNQAIAICGDYDADGMTSTALLIRALRALGARVDYAIPSRMSEGYGINQRIVEEFYEEGVQVILTVDNGIAAHQPIARARELGMHIIVTDHHDLPPVLPNASAILNPKQLPEWSPYRGLAGVGVAYILAISLAQSLDKAQGLSTPLLELFTLGTIADLAPLTAVNRRWVKRGLKLLPKSRLAGIQALIQVAGLSGARTLKPEAIGFRLGPRINAVGRIGDPQVVIELLTTDDEGVALERAMQCEQINQKRQELCVQIEQEAIALCEETPTRAQDDRVLLLVHPGWHHGVIGIVASRLVERYGVPVFICTYEDENREMIRGSARSIPEFHVFEALEYCKDLFEKQGGHRAAGGFSFKAENFAALRSRLREFAHRQLDPEHLKPLITVDAQATLDQMTFGLYQQIDALHPCGIENADPVFWTANVHVVDQRTIGKGHLKLTLSRGHGKSNGMAERMSAIAWRWGDYYPLPKHLDIAYRLRTEEWNGEISLQLELIGARRTQTPEPSSYAEVACAEIASAEFMQGDRSYCCRLAQNGADPVLTITNAKGKMLQVKKGQRIGTLSSSGETAREVNVCQPPYNDIIKAALDALNSLDRLNAERSLTN